MTEEKPKLGDEMKKKIEGAAKEHEKIVEGRAEFDSKKPNLFKEIEAKANEHQKVLEGKAEYEAKKPELFKEIKEKVDSKK